MKKISKPIPIRDGKMFLLNGCDDDCASTLITAHHRAGNITHPKGGRREMGVLYVYEDRQDYP